MVPSDLAYHVWFKTCASFNNKGLPFPAASWIIVLNLWWYPLPQVALHCTDQGDQAVIMQSYDIRIYFSDFISHTVNLAYGGLSSIVEEHLHQHLL